MTVPTDEIQKSLDAATPGPWEERANIPYSIDGSVVFRGRGDENRTLFRMQTKYHNHENNIRLVLNSPTWLRSLLEEYELLRNSNANLEHNRKLLSDEKQKLIEENERITKERDVWRESSKEQFSELFVLRSELAAKDMVLESIKNAPAYTSRTWMREQAGSILSQYAKGIDQAMAAEARLPEPVELPAHVEEAIMICFNQAYMSPIQIITNMNNIAHIFDNYNKDVLGALYVIRQFSRLPIGGGQDLLNALANWYEVKDERWEKREYGS